MSRGQKHSGVALVAVLWMVAALSIAVMGVTRVVRDDLRAAATQSQRLQGASVGDAAILMVLQQLHAQGRTSLGQAELMSVEFVGRPVSVSVTPITGLINLQRAPATLLADLFRYGAGLEPDAAQRWAEAVVAWRNRPGPQGQPAGIDAPEELLQIQGFPLEVYDKITTFVHCSTEGVGVNPRAAPAGVLAVLLGGQPERARNATTPVRAGSPDTSGVSPAHLDSSGSSRWVVTATVQGEDGSSIGREWMVQMAVGGRTLPWRVIRSRDVLLRGP